MKRVKKKTPRPLSGRRLDRAVAALMGDKPGDDGYWHSWDGGKAWTRDNGPRHYSTDAQALAVLKKFMITQGLWWQIRSPFYEGQPWHAGLTPFRTTGWNGRPDWRASGKTEAIACCRAALMTLGEPQL